MQEVVGVKFRSAAKTYYFGPKDIKFNMGDGVIVETARGQEYGTVSLPNTMVEENEIIPPLKDVIRKATEKDTRIQQENLVKREWAMKVCQDKINENELVMKLVDAEYTFDRSKVIFSFTAEGRVDFRELVKSLASVLRTRIELRQIYERDDIKLRGALAPCGRECCCHTHLPDFEKVSIKMAKNQGLSLNPQKISGVCGKLMCCLKYENAYYQEVNKRMPKYGAIVLTPDGEGRVENMDVLKCTVKVRVETKEDMYELKEYKLDDINPITKGSLAEQVSKPDEEEKLLKDLED